MKIVNRKVHFDFRKFLLDNSFIHTSVGIFCENESTIFLPPTGLPFSW